MQLEGGIPGIPTENRAPVKQAIVIKGPENWQQLYGFLRIAGFCGIWIPNYGFTAKPLHNSLKEMIQMLPNRLPLP